MGDKRNNELKQRYSSFGFLQQRLAVTLTVFSFLQGTTTTEITDRKFVSLDGLRCKYLVRKIIRTLSKPVVEPPRPTPTKSKRGRTLRPKIVLQPDDEDETQVSSGPRILEAWYPEVSDCDVNSCTAPGCQCHNNQYSLREAAWPTG